MRQDRERIFIKEAIAWGFGLTDAKVADYLNVSTVTVMRDRKNNQQLFDEFGRYVEGLIELYLSDRLLKRKASATAEQKIAEMFERSYAISEKSISKAEKLISILEQKSEDNPGDVEQTIKDLRTIYELSSEIHDKFTTWAARFVAEEKPKGLKVQAQIQHSHVFLLDETVDGLSAYLQHIGLPSVPPPVLPAATANYIDVSSEVTTNDGIDQSTSK